MRRFYVSAINQPEGPWIISHKSLETLDVLFKHVNSLLKEALTKHIDRTARQQAEEDNSNVDLSKRTLKLQRKYSYKSSFAEVTFSDGTTFRDEDLSGILGKIDATPSLKPTAIYIKTTQGDKENEFSLIIDSEASTEEADLEYRIKCLDEEIQDKIKSTIDKWLREYKSPQLLQLWSNKVVGFVWFIGVAITLISWANLSETQTLNSAGDYKASLEKAAHTIIEKGISSTKPDSVMLLLLKLQSNYTPNLKTETVEVQNKGYLKVLVFSFLIFVISLIRPRTIIGIGKNSARYNVYRVWIKLVCWVIGIICAGAITDNFVHFIRW